MPLPPPVHLMPLFADIFFIFASRRHAISLFCAVADTLII